MELPNARLKRLLDKQRRALALPKFQLGELEEEYAELLSRIESEKKRLGIDRAAVEQFITDMEDRYSADLMYLDSREMWKKQLKQLYTNLRTSANKGDVDNYRYYQKLLEDLWQHIREVARTNSRLSLFGGQYEM